MVSTSKKFFGEIGKKNGQKGHLYGFAVKNSNILWYDRGKIQC